MTRLAFNQHFSVGQVNEAAMLEPSQIAVRVAGPMSADGLISSEFDNLLSSVSAPCKSSTHSADHEPDNQGRYRIQLRITHQIPDDTGCHN